MQHDKRCMDVCSNVLMMRDIPEQPEQTDHKWLVVSDTRHTAKRMPHTCIRVRIQCVVCVDAHTQRERERDRERERERKMERGRDRQINGQPLR